MNPGRNDPCLCGSGKKFKKCCQDKFGFRLSPQSGQAKVNSVAPNPAELNQLIALFNAGHHAELEKQARSLIERYPDSGLAWKILGAALQVQGKDSLHALLKATEFLSGDAEAHYNLGNAFLALNRLDEAEASYRRSLKIRPDDADAHFNLGNTLRNLRRLDEAEASYMRALWIRPNHAETYGNLGNILMESGRIGEAETSYRKALQINPQYAAAHFNLGNLLQKQGRLDEAEASYMQALRIKPDHVEAYINLAGIFMESERCGEAEACYREALRYDPQYAAVHFNLGNTLMEQMRFAEAEASFRDALRIDPAYAEAHSGLSSALIWQSNLSEAETSARRALEINPDCAGAYYNLGAIFMELGLNDEAVASWQQALRIAPDHAKARYDLTRARKVNAGDENFAALIAAHEAVRSSAELLPRKFGELLHFALGKCYDDIGNHEKAFSHFLEGNKLKRPVLMHDADKQEQLFALIMRNLDAVAIDRLRGGGDLSRLPIFILGMPRSGTTLTEQIIASHPEVHGAGELPDLSGIVMRDVGGVAFPDNFRQIEREELAAWGAEYAAGLHRRAPDARRITDKTPGNFLEVGLIHLMLPNAKIIHVSRNPVDTCLSCFTTLFADGHAYSYDLAELGRYYSGYARLMEHWRRVLPGGAFLDVRYEDIVSDQEGQSRRILEYCGLEWNDACLDFHRNKRAVRTASMAQVRQPMYKSSVERWRPYEQHLKPLLDALGELAPNS